MKAKFNGQWKDPTAVYVKKNGAYVQATVYEKVAGAYKNGLSPTMFASNRTQFPAGVGVIGTVGSLWQADKVTFQAPDDWDVVGPVVVWPGFYCQRGASTDENQLTNNLQIRNASLFINGVFVKMLTFNGQAGITLTPGGTPYAICDRDPTITIPRGSSYSIVTQTVVAAGEYRLTSYYAGPNDGSAISGSSNRDAYVNGTTAFATPSPGVSMYGPCAIVGTGWTAGKKPVPLIFGDSIGFGKNDDNAFLSNEQVFGYINRAMIDTSGPGRYCYGNFCVPGTRLDGLSDARFGYRKAILQALGMPFTCIYSEMGINTTATSRIPDWEGTAGPFLRAMAGSKKIIVGTVIPQVGISDGTRGTNLTSQLVQNNSVWNNYVKGLSGTRLYIDDYIDNTTPFESSPGSGKFAVPSFTATLVNAISGSTTTFTLSAKPNVDDALIINPGASSLSAKMVKSVVRNADGVNWDVTTYFAFTATVAAGVTVAATNTEDGTHPTTQVSKVANSNIIAAKAAGVFT